MTILLFVCLIVLPANVYSENNKCSTAKEQYADALLKKLNSWDAVYHWYSAYRSCDDGYFAEGVSEAVARNLVDRWNTLPRFAQLARTKPAFRRFVLRHVDATLDSEDLSKINSNAGKRCPADVTDICGELKRKVERAKADS